MSEPDLFQIARDLIGIPSITGNEEPVAVYLERLLQGMGLPTRSQLVEPGRRNILAGPERPRVLFCTHMDTVPPYVPLREDATHLHGRGACDTKGIIASMLEAGRQLLARGVRDFGYLFVVGEEIDNAGAVHANRSVRAGHVIVGEPTENKIAVGHKGVYRARVRVRGKACHSAYPEQGDSAIHRLLRGLTNVLTADFGRSEILGPSTVNVGEISGGVAANVLAPEASATVMIRVVTDLADVEGRLQQCFLDPRTGRVDSRVEIADKKTITPPRLERVDGYPETIVSYGTDVPCLADVGKAVLFGPGTILDAHTDGEKIAKREMVEAVRAYVDLAQRLG